MTFDTLRAQSNADIRLNKQVLGVQTTATGYLSSSLVALYGLWGSTINGTAYTTPDASGCNGTNVGFFTVPNQGAAGGHNVKNSLDIAQHLNCNNAATGQTITSAQFWYR